MEEENLLSRLEKQAIEEGQEWTRKRLEELIKEVAEEQGDVSPPERERTDQETQERADSEHAGRNDQD